MSDLSIIQGKALTMSSKEIADLVESRHDNVKRTIETLANRGVIEFPQTEEISTATKPVQVYKLGKRDSLIVVAQLCPEFTARIVDRWQELEAAQVRPLELSRMDILKLAMESEQARIEAESKLAIAAPKADALDRIAADDKSMTFTQAAKVLGVKREALTQWLHANGWIYRQNGSWVAYDAQIKAGRLIYKEARYTDDVTSQEVYRPYCHITQKGLAKLAMFFGAEPEALAA